MHAITRLDHNINIYGLEEFEGLKQASSIAKDIMSELCAKAVPGISTKELEDLAENLINGAGCEPLFKGYQQFPFCTCMSLNSSIVHGLATSEPLKQGDVLSIDLGLKYQGFCSDHARTLIIGSPEGSEHLDLIKTAEEAFHAGLEKALPGNTTGDISFAINKVVHSKLNRPGDWRSGFKFKVSTDFQGHGIGLTLHEGPPVPNFGIKGKGFELLPGMCICIEPVVLYKSANVLKTQENGVVQYKTEDSSPSAHYENQVFIGPDGPIVLTL